MSQIVRVVLGLLLTLIVSRMLTPDDFGLIAMVAPVTAFVALIPSLGLGQALIQAEELTTDQINSAFWISLALGIACAAALLVAAPFVGRFFEDDRAVDLTMATAANLFVTNLSTVPSSVIMREMRFGKLSSGDLVGSITLFASTLVAALLLDNYWALWVGAFASAVLTTVYFWTVSSWRPTATPNFRSSSPLWKLSSAVTGFNVLNFLARNADNVLIGKFAGTYSLGLYDRSYRLMTFPLANLTEPLGRVMLPVLSQLRKEPERFRRAFLKVAWIVMLCTAPAAIVIASASETVIVFLLGERWVEAGDIFFWLSVGAIYQPLSSITGWLFISMGRSREMLQWALFSSVTTILSFCVGIFWGVAGVAMAYVLTSIARLPLLYHGTTRQTPISKGDLYMLLLPSCAAGIVIGLLAYLSEQEPTLVTLLTRAAISYAICAGVTLAVPEGRQALIELRSQLASMLRDMGARINGTSER